MKDSNLQNKKLLSALVNIYQKFDTSWILKNELPIHLARANDLVIGGGVGMALSHQKPFKNPGDLDFFTEEIGNAMSFINNVIDYLTSKSVYYSLNINNNTKFLLNDVSTHFRLRVPFWLPICVMVKTTPINKFYFKGMAVQHYNDIKGYAKEAEKKDGKPRIRIDSDGNTYDDEIDGLNNFFDRIYNIPVNKIKPSQECLYS